MVQTHHNVWLGLRCGKCGENADEKKIGREGCWVKETSMKCGHLENNIELQSMQKGSEDSFYINFKIIDCREDQQNLAQPLART